jgi:hypothetical protein
MIRIITTAILAVLLTGCGEEEAHKYLVEKGYTEITMMGYDFFEWRCGKNNAYQNQFIAKSSKGEKVKGVVCSGLLRYIAGEKPA